MKKLPQVKLNKNMIEEIKVIINNGRNNVLYTVNNELLNAYWNVGRIIVENEQNGNVKAEYGKQILLQLSKELTNSLGKGFSRSNLQNMRLFYLLFPKCQTVSGKLSWSHYIELLSIEDDNKRDFYEKEAKHSKWSVRTNKKNVAVEYALGGLENKVYASTYTFYIPNQEQLAREVEIALKEETEYE